MRILEARSEGIATLDFFRWMTLQGEPPQITVEVSIVRVNPPSKAHNELFVIEGGTYGGIHIVPLKKAED
jgi:hypothetical protein